MSATIPAVLADLRNWSEHPEPNAPTWTGCAYASWLTVLVAAGKRDFPLGAFTVAEREALERSDDRKDETGATPPDIITASIRRYGITPGSLAITTTAALVAELSRPGRAYSLAGQYDPRFFPAGDPLRRWQPGYTGPHQITAVPIDGASVLWLDPLAPMGHAGDVVPVAKAARFAWQDYTALYLGVGELAPPPPEADMPKLTALLVGKTAKVKAGAPIFAEPDGSTPPVFHVGPKGSNTGRALVGTVAGGWYVYWLNGAGWRYFQAAQLAAPLTDWPASSPPVDGRVAKAAPSLRTARAGLMAAMAALEVE